MADRIEVTLGIKVNGVPLWGGPLVRVRTVEELRVMSFDKNGGDTLPPTDQLPDGQLNTSDVFFMRTAKPLTVLIDTPEPGTIPLDADGLILIFGATGMEPLIRIANEGSDPDTINVVWGGESTI